MPTDPVCGMIVEKSPETLHATVRGATYYFCSESCLHEFTRPELELRKTKLSLALSASLGVPILILSYVPLGLSIPTGWLLLLLATPIQFVAGFRFYRGTYDAIKMRSSNMDVLIALGTSAAYFYSLVYILFPSQFPSGGLYFDTSAIVITLILAGRLLEYGVRARATDSIRKLAELQPQTVTVIQDKGETREIPIENLVVNDAFIVHPGQKVATDGTVLEGQSSVDEKLLTGESMPVEKTSGSEVIGGTLNGSTGALTVRATKVGTDTALSKIVRMVEDSINSRGPVERLVDTVSTYFVPIVIAIALIAFLGWTFVALHPPSFGFTAAVAVLIIACPCALGLATPAAIAVGAGKGAENGILIRGGEYLEKSEKIDTVIFDKTGTLTRGAPVVTDYGSTTKKFSDDEILKLAGIVEKRSEHPIATAVVKKASEKFGAIPEPDYFESFPGSGVKAKFSGQTIFLGTPSSGKDTKDPKLLQKFEDLRLQGKTISLLSVNNEEAGYIAVSDELKENAKETVARLQKMKLEVIMLTGDNRSTAAAIASEVGIKKFEAEVLPEKKSEVLKQLQSQGHRVAMVGDGLNDAPALAQADVGIAIGSGSDVAMETVGLILMKGDLRDVVAAIQLSRKTMRKIKENLFWAFVYNIVLIPVAAGLFYVFFGVLLNPIFAGLVMALSSVTVVTNSLTLKRFKPKF
jgi:P-type Cu+ transporter